MTPFDVLGNQRTVLGVSFLRGSADARSTSA